MPIGAIIGAIAGVSILILVIIAIVYYKLRVKLQLRYLPEDVRMHWEHYYSSSRGMCSKAEDEAEGCSVKGWRRVMVTKQTWT